MTFEVPHHHTRWSNAPSSGLCLSDELRTWLSALDVNYDTIVWTDNFRRSLTKVISIGFYERKDAILFKLIWL